MNTSRHRIRVEVQKRDGAIERLMNTVYRKGIRYTAFEAHQNDSVWIVEIEAVLLTNRADQVLTAIEREPSVLRAAILPSRT